MIAADLIRAALFGVMVLPIPAPALILLAFAAATATPAFETARSALLVAVVPEDLYPDTLALADMTGTIGVVAGFLAGGIVVAASGGSAALAINAGTFLVSAAAVVLVSEPARNVAVRSAKAHLAAGAIAIRRDPFLWRAAWFTTASNLPAMAVEASAAAYARLVLHGSAAVVGLLLVSVPVADLVATALCPRTGGPGKLMHRAALLVSIGGVLGVTGFAVGHLLGAVLGFAGAGIVFSLIAPAQSAAGPRIPAADRSGTFSLLQGSLSGAQAAGAAIGGLCTAFLGARLANIGAMSLSLFIGAVALVHRPEERSIPESDSDSAGDLNSVSRVPVEQSVADDPTYRR